MPVAHKALDVAQGHIQVGRSTAPVAGSGAHHHVEPGVAERLQVGNKVGKRIVHPAHHDHVFRKGLQELRVAHCNVSPEHEPFVVRLHDFSDLLDVIEINLADSYLVRQFFRLPLSELDGFV